uniref:Odorant receptor n=1 Tax=Helicoverpa armigera TaxID=29058 RepID=A0A7T3KBH8_HELAM|nr:odorant receptor [Helicoverpa armigera]
MEEFHNLPEEYRENIEHSLNLLTNGNILIFHKPNSFFEKRFRPYVVICSVVTYLASLTMYLGKVFRGELQLTELSYVVSVYMVSVQAILKAAIAYLNKEEIGSIILELGRLWRTQDLTEEQINKKNAQLKRLKFCYAVVYWINMIGSWQYILAPLLETVFRKFILHEECGLLLPFSCSFPFDPSGSWGRYIGVYIFETYSMFRIVYFYLGVEFLMISLCSNLATEFTLLQEDLQNVKPERNNIALKAIIANHQKLINLSQQLDNVFDKVIFVNLTSAAVPLCFFGFSAKVAHGVLQMVNNFAAVISLILPLFNMCYFGEQIREASAGISDSVYHNLWYRGDVRFQKILCFVQRRSQKPCCMTSYKFSPIALTTFTTVLSTTWSYFSLASSLYEGEN